jgi:hypothetical protein
MDGGDYFGVSDGRTRVIPGQKSACRNFHHIRNDKRASGNQPIAGEKPTYRYRSTFPKLDCRQAVRLVDRLRISQ